MPRRSHERQSDITRPNALYMMDTGFMSRRDVRVGASFRF
jgi:hypothetical protein